MRENSCTHNNISIITNYSLYCTLSWDHFPHLCLRPRPYPRQLLSPGLEMIDLLDTTQSFSWRTARTRWGIIAGYLLRGVNGEIGEIFDGSRRSRGSGELAREIELFAIACVTVYIHNAREKYAYSLNWTGIFLFCLCT